MQTMTEVPSTTVTKYRTRRGEIGYAYENDCGAFVAERTLIGKGWTVRLYLSDEEWTSYYDVPSAGTAERMCVEHVAVMS